jgi:hypothetical protein
MAAVVGSLEKCAEDVYPDRTTRIFNYDRR